MNGYDQMRGSCHRMFWRASRTLLQSLSINCPICHLVTTYFACVSEKYKIQLDFLFGDNLAV